jgi:PhnB protein
VHLREHRPLRFVSRGAAYAHRVTAAPSVLAQLSVRRGRAAIAFYEQAFGARVVHRVGGTDEHESVVAQLAVGDASFWVADESPEHANYSPETLGGGTVRMLLVVDDPDAGVARAVAAGAREVYPVEEAHGWRLGRIEDPFGHHWEIGRPLVPWPPARGGP